MRYAVLGAGLIGSAAARHLATLGHDVTLIGPAEPEDWATHDGVFASHYDEGRITRQLDVSPFWSAVSVASIERYAEIEETSNINFFNEVGGIYATADARILLRTAEKAGTPFERLVPHDGARFGYHLPSTVRVLYEPEKAGHVSPRRLVAAQQKAAQKHGAKRMIEVVRKAGEDGKVHTDQGVHEFDEILWAAGGFGAPHLDVPLEVQGRTVVFFEVTEAQATMPTLICADGKLIDIYMLPGIQYPDGKWYMKIGGGPHDRPLRTEAEMQAWYKSGGDPEAAKALTAIFQTLVPEVAVTSAHVKPCVTTYTPDLMPAIGRLSERVCVATAGCGRGAKCSDELGRLGAMALLGETDEALDPKRFKR
ncbi:MAG: FAD-dependent oxidoreductase [Pseudomonadota bacterium]